MKKILIAGIITAAFFLSATASAAPPTPARLCQLYLSAVSLYTANLMRDMQLKPAMDDVYMMLKGWGVPPKRAWSITSRIAATVPQMTVHQVVVLTSYRNQSILTEECVNQGWLKQKPTN